MPKSADLFANQNVFNRPPTYDSCAMDICSCPPPTLSTYPSQPAVRKAKQSTKLILTLVSVLCGARTTRCNCSKVHNHGLEGCSISGFQVYFQHTNSHFLNSIGCHLIPDLSSSRQNIIFLPPESQIRNHIDDTLQTLQDLGTINTKHPELSLQKTDIT